MLLKSVLLSVSILAFCSTFAAAATPMGQVSAVNGSATASGSGSRALQAGSEVFEGDNVSVTGGGNVQMVLDDGTKLVVGPSSKLVLKAYLRSGASTAQKVSVKAIRGTFRFITGNSKKSAYKIDTNTATIGIRGTGLDFAVGGKTTVAVLEGTVRMTGRNGQVIEASAGCEVAEAGANSTIARLIDGKPKSKILTRDLPYIVNQTPLQTEFHLPTANCLPFLAQNGAPAAPTISPIVAIPVIGAIAGGVVVLGQKDNPVSEEVTPPACVAPIYDYPDCADQCDKFCGTGKPPIFVCDETSSTPGCSD